MSEYALIRKSGLGLSAPTSDEWEGFSIEELENDSKFWMSTRGELTKLNSALKKSFSCELPDAGRFTHGPSSANPWCIASVNFGQWFVTGGSGKIPASIQKLAEITDQSDGWVGWRLSGIQVRTVLEKLIGLDLHATVFPSGSAARAPVERMMAILLCEDASTGVFTLYSQRSFARDFVERIRLAAYSACGERINANRDDG